MFTDKTRDIVIRPAREKDLTDVLCLYAQPKFDNGGILTLAQARRIFQRIRSYPDYKIYVVLIEKKIVGSFALLIMDNLGHRGTPSGIVEDVVVDEEYQRKGIGRAMMKCASRLCQEKNCYKLVLSSNLNRKQAHAFYKSLGFKMHGYSFRLDKLQEKGQDQLGFKQ